VKDRIATRGVLPVPLDEPLKEASDLAEPAPLGVLGQVRAVGAWLDREPHLVILEVCAGDAGDGIDVGLGHQEAGQLAQRVVGVVDGARRQEGAQLRQVAIHGGRNLGASGAEHSPFTRGLGVGDPLLVHCLKGAHALMASRASSSAACPASISSEALRYSSASQSLVKCR
jgi:hypothetical protein